MTKYQDLIEEKVTVSGRKKILFRRVQLLSNQPRPPKFSDEKRDCVVRAIQNSLGISYLKAHKYCESLAGRKRKHGTSVDRVLNSYELKDKFNFRVNDYSSRMKFGKRISVGEFLLEHYNGGNFILQINHHVFSVNKWKARDNNVEGNLNRRINYIYEIEKR